jgi:hypothetical protein
MELVHSFFPEWRPGRKRNITAQILMERGGTSGFERAIGGVVQAIGDAIDTFKQPVEFLDSQAAGDRDCLFSPRFDEHPR